MCDAYWSVRACVYARAMCVHLFYVYEMCACACVMRIGVCVHACMHAQCVCMFFMCMRCVRVLCVCMCDACACMSLCMHVSV